MFAIYIAYFIELDDVGVSNFLENFDFSGDAFNILLVVYFFLLKNFDSNLNFRNKS